jgi:NitT/TauT family transport system substrate-binding protein
MARQREAATGKMRRSRWIILAFAASLALGRPAAADVATLRVVTPEDLATLSLIVADHNHLVEKQARARGLGGVAVQWLSPAGGDPLSELLSGQADVVATTDVIGFLLAWDERTGTPQEIRGLAGLAQMPYQLLSRNPAVATIRDFTAKDRIAVPALKLSLPAVMLELAAAGEWGIAQYDKLDPLTVARSGAEADAAIHAGKGDITADFARMPYADDERGDPAIHRVMDSFDIVGSHSVGVVVTTAQFRDANPALCASLVAAMTEAGEFIKQSRGAAAEIYDREVKHNSIALEDLTDMLGDPDVSFTAAPAGMLRLVAFLHQIGRLKHNPDSWQQLFFPEIYKQPGS